MKVSMNPMITFMKKQGLKVSLPLLLLATGCDTQSLSAALRPSNVVSSDFTADVMEPSSDTPETSSAATMPSPAVASDGSSKETVTEAPVPSLSVAGDTAASVPEPATLAGLAIAGLGMGAIKRKRAA